MTKTMPSEHFGCNCSFENKLNANITQICEKLKTNVCIVVGCQSQYWAAEVNLLSVENGVSK